MRQYVQSQKQEIGQEEKEREQRTKGEKKTGGRITLLSVYTHVYTCTHTKYHVYIDLGCNSPH